VGAAGLGDLDRAFGYPQRLIVLAALVEGEGQHRGGQSAGRVAHAGQGLIQLAQLGQHVPRRSDVAQDLELVEPCRAGRPVATGSGVSLSRGAVAGDGHRRVSAPARDRAGLFQELGPMLFALLEPDRPVVELEGLRERAHCRRSHRRVLQGPAGSAAAR
jgi:hypothetical protein